MHGQMEKLIESWTTILHPAEASCHAKGVDGNVVSAIAKVKVTNFPLMSEEPVYLKRNPVALTACI